MKDNPTKQAQSASGAQESLRRRNAVWIAVVTGTLMTVITAATLPVALQIGPERLWGPGITATAAIMAFVSAFISSRNRPTLGSSILISVILILSLVVTFLFANDQGIALAAIVIVVVATIAIYTMPPVWAARLIVASVVLGIADILADFYLPNLGVPNDPRYTNAFAIILSAIYIVIILGRFNQLPLRAKLVISFILLTLIPVLLLGIQNTTITTRNLKQQANSDLSERAKTSARAIDNILMNELKAIQTEAQIIDFANYITLLNRERSGSREERNAYAILLSLQRKNSVFISSYALVDANGTDLMDTYRQDTGTNKGNQDYFREPIFSGLPYISPVRFSQTGAENSIYFSAPVRNASGDIIGVLCARYNMLFLQNILKESVTTDNEEEYAVLVDNETFASLAHTLGGKPSYKTYQTLTPEQVLDLQKQLRLPPGTVQAVSSPQADLLQGIQNLDRQPVFTSLSNIYNTPSYNGGYKVEDANWTVLVTRTERSILAPIELQTRAITVSSLLFVVFAGLAGILLAQVLARPLVQLAGVAAEITNGNLDARAIVQTQDEIGGLANSFNRMTGQLKDTLGAMERRVVERTADLEMARLLSERRAQELQAISEISRVISTEQRLNILLPLVTRLVSERFEFYHVGIFFMDAARRFAYLQASNSEGGGKMLARGHHLEVGTGIVGMVAQTGKARIALDVGADAVFFGNPDLPNTRSEMALPLNVRGQTIGVLDIQSTKPGAFTQNDANTLTILADQVAIAIDNARLFGQTQQARDEAEALYAQILQNEWSAFVKQEENIGYRQSTFGGKQLNTPVESEEIRQALEKGEAVVLEAKEGNSQPVIALPVKLRGQTIGVLNIKAPTKSRKWNQDEINLVQAVSDRLALALDNARLLHESQRRAAKEARIGEVSARISASMNLRNVLQTAVEELGRALPGSEVVIQFEQPEQQR